MTLPTASFFNCILPSVLRACAEDPQLTVRQEEVLREAADVCNFVADPRVPHISKLLADWARLMIRETPEGWRE